MNPFMTDVPTSTVPETMCGAPTPKLNDPPTFLDANPGLRGFGNRTSPYDIRLRDSNVVEANVTRAVLDLYRHAVVRSARVVVGPATMKVDVPDCWTDVDSTLSVRGRSMPRGAEIRERQLATRLDSNRVGSVPTLELSVHECALQRSDQLASGQRARSEQERAAGYVLEPIGPNTKFVRTCPPPPSMTMPWREPCAI